MNNIYCCTAENSIMTLKATSKSYRGSFLFWKTKHKFEKLIDKCKRMFYTYHHGSEMHHTIQKTYPQTVR